MLGKSTNSRQRMPKQARRQLEHRSRGARRLAGRLMDRGKHRAEAIRDSLPEPEEVMNDLREQAQPVVERARERAMQASGRKRSRSKKPLLLIALLAVAAGVAAYLLFIRRDQEPAYLMTEPDRPDVEPASPAPSGSSPADDSPRPNETPDWRSPSQPAPAGYPASEQQPVSAPVGTLGHHPVAPPAPQQTLHQDAAAPRGEAQHAEPARAESPRAESASAAPSASSPSASNTGASSTSSPSSTGPASVYEAWTATRPAQRAAWDLPRSATPPHTSR